jgi:glycosyltransferase involved in cell wall biosynthesis
MSNSSIRILVVHSSAELYGSDRSLLDFVQHRHPALQITVALPGPGVLVGELEAAGATVIVGNVCKIQRGMLSPTGMVKVLISAYRAIQFMGAAHRRTGFDLVYSNTVAILGGAFCARLWRVPHIWHVREILRGSRVLSSGFQHLVARMSRTVVCNSAHTLDWIRLQSSSVDYQVVWNGFEVPVVSGDARAERARLGASSQDVLFVLVGRINAWKGQRLLLEAFTKLQASCPAPTRLAFVGSAPPDQLHYEAELRQLVAASGLAARITMVPYSDEISLIWQAADVVVVPSTEPEPFGRVAIEAMGYGRPVIAAAHGGLVEIVEDGETGRLVEPRNVAALTEAMCDLAVDPDARRRMGNAGRARQVALFTVAVYASRMNDIMQAALSDHRAG